MPPPGEKQFWTQNGLYPVSRRVRGKVPLGVNEWFNGGSNERSNEGSLLWPPLHPLIQDAVWRWAECASVRFLSEAIDEKNPVTFSRQVFSELNEEVGTRVATCEEGGRLVAALFLSEERLYSDCIGVVLRKVMVDQGFALEDIKVIPRRLIFWPDPEKRRWVLDWLAAKVAAETSVLYDEKKALSTPPLPRQDSVSLNVRQRPFRGVSHGLFVVPASGGVGDEGNIEGCFENRYFVLQCLYPVTIRILRGGCQQRFFEKRRLFLKKRKGDTDDLFHWTQRDLHNVFGEDWASSRMKEVHLEAGQAYMFHPLSIIDYDTGSVPNENTCLLLSEIFLGISSRGASSLPLPPHLNWRRETLNKHCLI